MQDRKSWSIDKCGNKKMSKPITNYWQLHKKARKADIEEEDDEENKKGRDIKPSQKRNLPELVSSIVYLRLMSQTSRLTDSLTRIVLPMWTLFELSAKSQDFII